MKRLLLLFLLVIAGGVATAAYVSQGRGKPDGAWVPSAELRGTCATPPCLSGMAIEFDESKKRGLRSAGIEFDEQKKRGLRSAGIEFDEERKRGLRSVSIEFEQPPAMSGPGGTPNWTDPTNWSNLVPPTFPNNVGGETFSAVMSATELLRGGIIPPDLCLDSNITIEALRLFDGAVLRVQEAACLLSGSGNLNVVSGGGVLLGVPPPLPLQGEPQPGGKILVSGARIVHVPNGIFTLGNGGVYARDPVASGITSASLDAKGVLILCGCASMSLEQSMTLKTTDDLVLDGTNRLLPCDETCPPPYSFCPPCDMRKGLRGGIIPPDLFMDTPGNIVGRDFWLLGSTSFNLTASGAITIGGNFNNQSTTPECVHLDGALVFGGGALRGVERGASIFEASGVDRGPSYAGFHDNFAVGAIEVVSNHALTVVNTCPSPPCNALYVKQLKIGPGASLSTAGTRIYYQVLYNSGTLNANAECGACAVGDINCSGIVDVDDLICLLEAFAGTSVCYGADLYPCSCVENGDGVIDVDDLIVLLLAFAGENACAR